MIDRAIYEKMRDYFEFTSIDTLWRMTEYADKFGFPKLYSANYSNRIELFTKVLKELLIEGKMKLANGGIFPEGTPEEQANLFKSAFPKSAREMEEKEAYWWYTNECPGGAVWYTDIDDGGFQTTPVGDGRYYFWT